jgi:uncharacterized protein (TIGR03086 family)
MSGKTVDLAPAAQRLADLVARVGDDELGGPTPCPAYSLGDLIEHVGGLALAFRAAAEKDTASPYVNHTPSCDASRLGEGWRARIPADLAALARAWAEPGAWTGMTRIASPDAPAGPEVAFGPSREVPGDAPALDQVLALAGRDPAWVGG